MLHPKGADVHEGGSTPQWGTWWVKAGYAAVAFELALMQRSGEPRVILIGSLDIFLRALILFVGGYLKFVKPKGSGRRMSG